MIEHIKGDILQIEADLLVNAANAKGWMGGLLGRFFKLKCVAESIHYADNSIERKAKKAMKLQKAICGDTIHTTAGKLNYPKGILHAVTMLKPGQSSDLATIETCIDNLLVYCTQHEINTVALPFLGTGTGRLNKEAITVLYEEKLKRTKIKFFIVHYYKQR